jgi:hypothetical protein
VLTDNAYELRITPINKQEPTPLHEVHPRHQHALVYGLRRVRIPHQCFQVNNLYE